MTGVGTRKAAAVSHFATTSVAEVPAPDIPLAIRLFDELRRRTGGGRPEDGVTRASYGLGEQIAHEIVRREALRLGMTCEIDAGCNLYMTLKGRSGGPGVFIGSHLDSVPHGGNFDGAAGVLAGLAIAAGFRKSGRKPARDLTIMAIRAEESTWFGASYIGSRAAFGALGSDELDNVRRANDGIALGTAIQSVGGDLDLLRSGHSHLEARRIAAFIEPHIEQGPVLVSSDQPVAIVTGIRGSFRYRHAACLGAYSHSGATPRSHRKDAALATARLVVAMDDVWARLSGEGHDLAVTFGKLSTDAEQAAFSKVAGRVEFSLDVRSEDLETLDLVRAELMRCVAEIEAACSVCFELGRETGSMPAKMDRGLQARLLRAAKGAGLDPATMPCGAGHDAAVFAQNGVPTAMIFIRNRNGSHNPFEAMEMDDFAQAARLLCSFCAMDDDGSAPQ